VKLTPKGVSRPPPAPDPFADVDVVARVPGDLAAPPTLPAPVPRGAPIYSAPTTTRSAKPRSGGSAGELDDVWLLLSDDVARLISALLLIVMLAASVYASHKLVSVITERADIPDQLSSRFGSFMWMTTAWSIFLFFVMIVPLVLGAGALACLWTKWTLPERPLLRAAGAATVPYLLLFTIGLLAVYEQKFAALGVVLATPLVLIVALKELMGMRWSATAVTALLLLVAVPVMSLLTFPISLWVNSRMMVIAQIDPESVEKWMKEHPEEARALQDARLLRQNQPWGVTPPSPTSPPSAGGTGSLRGRVAGPGVGVGGFQTPAVTSVLNDPLYEKLQPIITELQQVDNLSRNKSREELQQAYDRLAPQVNALEPGDRSPPSPRWNVASEMLKGLERRIKEAPSETPPKEVFEAIAARRVSPLQVPQAEAGEFLNEEFRFQDVRIRPLKRVKVNVDSFLRGTTTQRWDLTSTASIELELLPLRDPKQQRPWVASRRFIQKFAEEKNLLAFADDGFDGPQYGRIGEIGWTRIAKAQGERTSEIQYVGRLPDQWLIVRLKSIRPTENEIDAIDKFVQGIGYARASATTGQVAGAPVNAPTAPPPPPAVAAAGRGAGEINVLLDVIGGSGNSWDKTDALKKLGKIKPADAQQRDVVASVLEQFIVTDAAFIADEAAETLGVWHRPQTVDVLLPLLDEKEWVSWKRTRAMKVLGRTRDKRAATPIMRWVLKDTDNVVVAMIDLGPAGEDEAIARLRERDATARAAAARILSAVGTQKCLIELRRAANDPRDARAATVARSALETVLARVKQAKAAAAAATTSPATLPAR
jgi:hypothetical protein